MEWAQLAMREAGLFAATGFLLLGLSDLAVDLVWIVQRMRRGRGSVPFPRAARPGALALFVPAWDEGRVIGAMLGHTLKAWVDAEVTIFVGCYPNDPATIAAVRAVADPRLRLVVGPVPGPTSKADCLNRLWEAMRAEEAAMGRRFKAVLLHDAEDVVHSAEPAVFDALTERFDLVQIPVVPLIDPESRWISAHYADEFAESHGKELVVRSALGAALPSAGVGCAVSRDALDALAADHGYPFDPDSLTEDYELGLRLRALGRPAAFVRLSPGPGRPPVATRAYFPATLGAAVAQKARWTTGIALAGWDRLGWAGGWAERWMRLRDRQALLAALLLFVGYSAALLWSLLLAVDLAGGWERAPLPPALRLLLAVNLGLLAWRLAMRFGFVASTYGGREGVWALARVPVSNLIAMLAARRALVRYLGLRRTGSADWDKTAHLFPAELPAE